MTDEHQDIQEIQKTPDVAENETATELDEESQAMSMSGTKRSGIPITSTRFGKTGANQIRQRLDPNHKNEFRSGDLSALVEEFSEGKKKNQMLRYMVFGLLGLVVLLIGTTFATAWLAVSLNEQVKTDNDQLRSRNTGETLATKSHNDNMAVTPSTSQDDPCAFSVPAAGVHIAWNKYEQGNLGFALQVSWDVASGLDNEQSNTGTGLGLVSTTRVLRQVSPDSADQVTYGPVAMQAAPDDTFNVVCPVGNAGFCQVCSTVDPADRKLQGCGPQTPLGCPSTHSCQNQVCVKDETCFSAVSTVELKNGSRVSMTDLQVGDVVSVGNNSYLPVVAFSAKHKTEVTVFHQLFTEAFPEEPLEITSDHLVYRVGEDAPVPASIIKVGEVLQGVENANLRVTKIESVTRNGFYSPLTGNGKVVVNGVLSSNYIAGVPHETNVKVGSLDTGISWHTLDHMFALPYRFYCTKISPQTCQEADFGSTGHATWIKFGLDILDAYRANEVWVQLVLFVSIVPFIVVFFLLLFLVDQLLNYSWLFAIFAATVTLFGTLKIGSVQRGENALKTKMA